MTKKFLIGLLFGLAVRAEAQPVVQFTDFANTFNGFTATMLFKNVNNFGDPSIITIGNSFVVRTSAKIATFCSPVAIFCSISQDGAAGALHKSGNVQTSALVTGPAPDQFYQNAFFLSEDSCAANDCLSRAYSSNGAGLLGCQAPAAIGGTQYLARTCAAIGFDGWLALGLRFTFTPGAAGVPQFDLSDLSVDFTQRTLVGPNVLTTPEPATWGMMLVGLGVIAGLRRRRVK